VRIPCLPADAGPLSSCLGKARALFGSELKTLMQELNEVLVS